MVAIKNTLLLAMAASIRASPVAGGSSTSTAAAPMQTITWSEEDVWIPPAIPEGATDISNNTALVHELKEENGFKITDEGITKNAPAPDDVTIMSGPCDQGTCPDYSKSFDMLYTWSQQTTVSPGGAPPNVLVWQDFDIRVNDCGKCYRKRVGGIGGGCYDFTGCNRAQSICVDPGRHRAHRIWKDNGHKTCYSMDQISLGGCGIIMERSIHRLAAEVACNW